MKIYEKWKRENWGQLWFDINHLPTDCLRPQSQQTHIPAPGKTTRTKSQLQACTGKSQPTMSLEDDKESTAQGTCRHCRAANITEGCQGSLLVVSPKDARREQRTLTTGAKSLWYWCAALSAFEKVRSMTNFKLLDKCILYFGWSLADSELNPSTTHIQGTYDFWIKCRYHLPSDFHQILHSEHLKKFRFVYSGKLEKISEFSHRLKDISCYSNIGSTCRYLHDRQIARCEQVCKRIELQIFIFCGQATYGPFSRASIVACRWATGGTWNFLALDQAIL